MLNCQQHAINLRIVKSSVHAHQKYDNVQLYMEHFLEEILDDGLYDGMYTKQVL